MRYYLITISVLFVNLFTSAQFQDDFSDGDFSANPTWSGSTGVFQVNGSFQLQLNDAIAATTYLYANNVLADLDSVEWVFYIREAFSPSANNYGRVYLVSDQMDLTGSLNGYYLQFGESGSNDKIELFEQTGLTSTSVCQGTLGAIASSFEVRVRVLRNHLGDWEIWTDHTGGTNYTLEASGNDATHNTSAFIGVLCNYTVSNATDFYFDDFYSGDYILDVTPPDVSSVIATSANDLDVQFNEPVDLTSSENVANYSVDAGIGVPTTATRDAVDSSIVHLNFTNAFTNGNTYELTTNNVADVAANVMSTSLDTFIYALVGTPGFRDVVINEIFPDPDPQIGLPTEEFIEIYNNSNTFFDLSGWEFSDGTTTGTFGTYMLAPGEYAIVCDDADSALFGPYGTVLTLASFPTLNNSGDNLVLTDGSATIDAVNYSDSWYRDATKEDGGYTLELINPTIPCSDPSNWIGSFHPNGGTPAAANSQAVFDPDTINPAVVDAYAHSLDSVKIVFSEALDAAALGSLALLFSNGLGFTESLDSNDPACLWIATFPAMTPGESFTIDIAGLSDCSGNSMAATQVTIDVPEAAANGDIVINEVLFNPVTGGSDFVEIYNRSDKVLSLKNWNLANWDDDTVDNIKEIISTQWVMQPGDYVVLTKDSANIKTEYPLSVAGTFIQMASLPAYNNDSGTVFLLDATGMRIDRFAYTDDMHFGLLSDDDGVSLERIDFDRPSEDETNWHSAAEAVGYATPGYLNSQYSQGGTGTGTLTVTPEIFSPDNDGMDDVLNIDYTFETGGQVASVAVFDAHGRLMKWIVQNELIGTDGTISWDGTDEGNEKVPIGIYVIYFETFDLNGNVNKFKRSCVVGANL